VIGFILIFAVVALNIVYLFLAESDVNIQIKFGIMLRSTFGAVTVWFTISLFVVYVKQSGLPYRSPQEYTKLRYIGIIFALWTISFIIKIIIYSVAQSDDGKNPS
jgi:hypothetical protein